MIKSQFAKLQSMLKLSTIHSYRTVIYKGSFEIFTISTHISAPRHKRKRPFWSNVYSAKSFPICLVCVLAQIGRMLPDFTDRFQRIAGKETKSESFCRHPSSVPPSPWLQQTKQNKPYRNTSNRLFFNNSLIFYVQIKEELWKLKERQVKPSCRLPYITHFLPYYRYTALLDLCLKTGLKLKLFLRYLLNYWKWNKLLNVLDAKNKACHIWFWLFVFVFVVLYGNGCYCLLLNQLLLFN